jgi:hypothetical protein
MLPHLLLVRELLCQIVACGLYDVQPRAGKWSEGLGWPHSKSPDATHIRPNCSPLHPWRA